LRELWSKDVTLAGRVKGGPSLGWIGIIVGTGGLSPKSTLLLKGTADVQPLIVKLDSTASKLRSKPFSSF
jgi:hypothetical protein